MCPKHIKEINEVITCQSIDKKGKLKEIIVNSIYNELSAVLKPDHNINQASDIIDVGGYQISTKVYPEKHSVYRETNKAYFRYIPKTNSYGFSDRNRKFYIQTCDDNNGEILIKDYNNIVKQKITDDNLTKLAKRCLIFLTSVSLVELEMYHQTFTEGIT